MRNELHQEIVVIKGVNDILALASSRAGFVRKGSNIVSAGIKTTVQVPVVLVKRTGMLLTDILRAVATHTMGVGEDVCAIWRSEMLFNVIRTDPMAVLTIVNELEVADRATLSSFLEVFGAEAMDALSKRARVLREELEVETETELEPANATLIDPAGVVMKETTTTVVESEPAATVAEVRRNRDDKVAREEIRSEMQGQIDKVAVGLKAQLRSEIDRMHTDLLASMTQLVTAMKPQEEKKIVVTG
jgi:hypothetical protein